MKPRELDQLLIAVRMCSGSGRGPSRGGGSVRGSIGLVRRWVRRGARLAGHLGHERGEAGRGHRVRCGAQLLHGVEEARGLFGQLGISGHRRELVLPQV